MSRELVVTIFNDKRYLSICKSIAKQTHLAEDLHSEFITSLLEIKDNRLTEAKEGGYLEVFCVGIINNIWNNRNRVKTYITGKTSPLFEYSNTVSVAENSFDIAQSEYNHRIDYTYKAATKLINKERNSPNDTVMYNSSVFYHSNYTCKNAFQYSKKSNIPYMTVKTTYNNYKKYLIDKLKHILYD